MNPNNDVIKIAKLETNIDWIVAEQKEQSKMLKEMSATLNTTAVRLCEHCDRDDKELVSINKKLDDHNTRLTEAEGFIGKALGGLAVLTIVINAVLAIFKH